MKKIFVILGCLLISLLTYSQTVIEPSIVKLNYQNKSSKEIKHYAYTTCIDTTINLPLWVSHAISKEIIKAGEISRKRPNNPSYPKDESYPKLKNNAYTSSGYDHGHLAPARDFKWNSIAWNECFFMTNMTPQHGCLNQRGWCYLECLCRHWAETSSDNEIIYIVSGIVPGKYIDTLCISKNLRVFVPAKFYKVVLSYNPITKSAKGIGFITDNGDVDNETALNSRCTINKVEEAVKLDFFSFLNDSIENAVESKIGFTDYSCKSECPDKNCDAVYSKRVRPEDRTKLRCK